MARTKKGEINKSQAIRDYLASHKRAKAAEVVAGLAEKGIEVAPPLVYANMAKGKTRRGKAKTGRGAPSTNGSFSLDSLLAAKKLVDSVGGVDQARATLDVLAKLA